MVPQDMLLWFHTHDTASNAIAQNLAAIERCRWYGFI